jgi:hypothetical protein
MEMLQELFCSNWAGLLGPQDEDTTILQNTGNSNLWQQHYEDVKSHNYFVIILLLKMCDLTDQKHYLHQAVIFTDF